MRNIGILGVINPSISEFYKAKHSRIVMCCAVLKIRSQEADHDA